MELGALFGIPTLQQQPARMMATARREGKVANGFFMPGHMQHAGLLCRAKGEAA